MEWYRNLKIEGTGVWWGIYGKQNNEFCGAAGFNSLEKQYKKAEIGLWLLKEFWGKGILKEVMPKLFEQGFSKLNLNRIEGYVVSDNAKCKNALEKIHFTYEGTMRECEIKDGEKIDVDIYSVLKAEWKKIKSITKLFLVLFPSITPLLIKPVLCPLSLCKEYPVLGVKMV